jgi:hypothetical protein
MVHESFIFAAGDGYAKFHKARHRAGPEFGVFVTGTFFPISKWSCEFYHVEPTGEVEERRQDKKMKMKIHCEGEKVVNIL